MAMPTDIGVVDLMLGFPFTSVEEKKATYDFFRPLLKDEQSAKDFEFPAQYMFKGVPDVVDPDTCLLYTSPSPRDGLLSRMPSSA